jgi:outer membrane scaffolding protein for murein synthesis (MipA/OmpV family)
MMNLKLYSCTLAATAAVLAAAPATAQEVVPLTIPQDVNLIGLGVFSVPDYYGSTKNTGAAAPLARYSWDDSGRYAQLLGPELTVNLMPMREWRVGPLMRFRSRRDDDVEDSIVKRMQPIPTATEVGAFVAYHMPLDPNQPMHKVVFSADIVGNTTHVYNGATGNLRVNYYYPFPEPVGGKPLIGTVGFGMFFANSSFNRKYFGVTGSDVALFPGLGGREYRPEGGLTSIKIPFTLTAQLDKQWLLTFAGRYEKLLNDAKDSPVVNGRGDENQWLFGVAASYLF